MNIATSKTLACPKGGRGWSIALQLIKQQHKHIPDSGSPLVTVCDNLVDPTGHDCYTHTQLVNQYLRIYKKKH